MDQDWQLPKKTARVNVETPPITTHRNRYANLPEEDAGRKQRRVPPVIMEVKGTHAQTVDLIKSIVKSTFNLRYTGGGNVAINCASLEARATLLEGLKGQRAFHTFTTEEDKTVKSVLRGLPEIPTDDIVADLQRQGLDVVKVTAMKSKAEIPGGSRLYLVQFSSDTTTTHIRSIRYVCFTKAILERYRRNTGHLTQCFRCQLYGHAAKNCQRPPRCVKCTGDHATADCAKADRDTPANCAGCGAEHPANYKGCPRREEYLKRTKRQQPKTVQSAAPAAPKPLFALNQEQFPALRPVKPAFQWASAAPVAQVSDPAAAPTSAPKRTPTKSTPNQPEGPPASPMSTEDLRKMLMVLQEIRVKAGNCASKMEIAIMLVEYLDVLF